MSHRLRFASTFLLATTIAAAACSTDKNEVRVGEGQANYGDERIGYKLPKDVVDQQNAALEAAGEQGGFGPSSGSRGDLASPSDPMFAGAGGSAGAGGGAGAGGSLVFPPPSSDAGVAVEAGVIAEGGVDGGDGGMEAGGADAGTDAEAGVAQADAGEASTSSPSLQLLQFQPDTPPPLENPFRSTREMAASTFSIDVDTGSYTLARASVNAGFLPDRESVRIEEFLNYFHFHYAQPRNDTPFSIYAEMSDCPWDSKRKLMLLGIQGQEVPLEEQPAANLVFLLDVSGSMSAPNKLPLLKSGFRMLTRQLRPQDRVSIVTYAGNESVVLEGVGGGDKDTILAALDGLESGGSTNGEGGIQKAYELAQEHYIDGGNNRVLLATDGDFNVGLSDVAGLSSFIATKRDTGVFLSVYGFGDAWDGGNYQDATAEQLADNGNGIYFYIDGPEEARRAFIHTVTGSLLTIAKDVKVQVEFNPGEVKAYRLIGYENRVLSNSDFDNDAVDAGELGAGLSVTALFEVIPASSSQSIPEALPGTDPLEALSSESTEEPTETEPVEGDDLVAVRIRYKDRDADSSQLIQHEYSRERFSSETPSMKFWFASAVAEAAMQLRGSQYLPSNRRSALLEQIQAAYPADVEGAVREFHDLTRAVHSLVR